MRWPRKPSVVSFLVRLSRLSTFSLNFLNLFVVFFSSQFSFPSCRLRRSACDNGLKVNRVNSPCHICAENALAQFLVAFQLRLMAETLFIKIHNWIKLLRCYCGHNCHFHWTDERAVIHSAQHTHTHTLHAKWTFFENETNSFGLWIPNERPTCHWSEYT